MLKNKKQLYNSIMMDVAKIVKQKLNESDDSEVIATIDTIDFGLCTIKAAYDTEDGDFYVVYDEDDQFVCEIPGSTNLNDEDAIQAEIDYALDSH